jgi:hypothetical protein
MASGGVIHMPSFIKMGLGVQKLLRRIACRHTKQGDLISILLMFSK